MECNLTLSDAADTRRHHNGRKTAAKKGNRYDRGGRLARSEGNRKADDTGVAAARPPSETDHSIVILVFFAMTRSSFST
jgi:hypothetical protein